MVSPDSPAEEAGLETGDQILKFGNLCDRGETGPDKLFQSLPASVVEGTPIKLVVYRDPNLKDSTKCKRTRICVEDESRILELVLTPKRWDGRGLLGLHIVPLDASTKLQ